MDCCFNKLDFLNNRELIMKNSLDVSYSIGLNLQSEVPQVVSRRKQLSGCIAALVVGAS